MLAHLIQFNGKGKWVLGLPLCIAIVLFILFDALGIKTKYVRPVCLISSAIIIWFVDKGPELLNYGKSSTRGQNTVMWIDMKFWAIGLAIAGFVSLAFMDE